MNLARLWAVARKEFLHVIRDARSLGMAIAIPMLLLLLYVYALTLDVDRVPLVVWDQSRSHASRELLQHFFASRYFAFYAGADTYAEVEHAIDAAHALGALVIPYDFADRVEAGRPVAVQLIVDGSDSNTATIALGYAQAVVFAYSQQVTLQTVQRAGIRPPDPPLDLRPRVWFNADLESRNFIIPGLIAVIMMVIAALLTSLTVAREWEGGTMEQLISTPVKPTELILGKLLPYFAIGMLDMVLAVLMGQFLFHVPLRGSLVLLFGTASLFLLGTLSLGILISVLAKNQLLANQLAMVLTFLPSFLLSGFVYAISNMPQPIQIVSRIIPARYFITALKGVYLKGVGLHVLWLEVLLLAVFAAVMLTLAVARFKKRLA